ncbi:Holliday junction resolvase RuvX [Rhodocyclus tenuis]|uniref:Putative pre-16S rRNA nuclease n=2 Tax=Rhodocyclus TaxID=1064 RepID=A0A6L5JX95_RHOTE|nr:Holliday junction resolvase RuvX [Rhodocyclus gracilis]MQY51452.1 Holliday junction resolvase RuvX [Rhodocyclus gracilis]MRD72194.1 Holliday junction resolvase RuvX [Rhodocyclus gracilis]NJA89300.1 Holliday junction resolvase RuvX [Rhodocyclus gracilis]
MPESHATANPRMGAVLAFDFGERRIGVAVGESLLGHAHPLTVIDSAANAERFAAIAALIEEWQPSQLVVGLPLSLDGEEHAMTLRCRRFGNQLRGRFALAVDYVDERLSSVEAAGRLRDNGVNARNARGRIDAVAAQIILQSYFDAHPAPASPLTPPTT